MSDAQDFHDAVVEAHHNSPPPDNLATGRDLIFLDTETTSLDWHDGPRVWELYAERHNATGGIEIAHLFPAHYPHPDISLVPSHFIDDYRERVAPKADRTPVEETGKVLAQVLRHRDHEHNPPPIVVGANPAFDMNHLAAYLAAAELTDGSHFRRLDIEAACYGAMGHIPAGGAGGLVALAQRFGVADLGAHTARGDVQMVKNLYRAIFASDRRQP